MRELHLIQVPYMTIYCMLLLFKIPGPDFYATFSSEKQFKGTKNMHNSLSA